MQKFIQTYIIFKERVILRIVKLFFHNNLTDSFFSKAISCVSLVSLICKDVIVTIKLKINIKQNKIPIKNNNDGG